jgi:tRNA(Arg) A34 adenosine deaminase TadA
MDHQSVSMRQSSIQMGETICADEAAKTHGHEEYMRQAMYVAREALRKGEVPVGCIIVWDPIDARNEDSNTDPTDTHKAATPPALPPPEPMVVSFGANLVNATRDATRHAELVAIDRLISHGVSSDDLCLPDTALPVSCRQESDQATAFPNLDGPHAKSWVDSYSDWKSMVAHFWREIAKYNGGTAPSVQHVMAHCDLYVTCEPCIMCAAALRRVGIRRVFYGCQNDRFGGCGGLLSLDRNSSTDGKNKESFECVKGVLEKEAISLLRTFYKRENCHAPDDKRKRKESPVPS